MTIQRGPDGNMYDVQPDGSYVPVNQSTVANQPVSLQSIAPLAQSIGTPIAEHAISSAVGVPFAPLAGAAVGTYLAGKAGISELQGKQDNSMQGLAGRAQLDVSTGGLAELARPFLSHKTTGQYQADADAKITSDANNPTGAAFVASRNAAAPSTGNYKGKVDTSADPTFAGINPATGQWVNNAFASSGNVADLKANDLVGMDSNLSQFGNDWLGKYTDSQRQAIDQAALDSGDVKMSKGMADINWSDPALAAKISAITSGKTSTKSPSLSSIAPGDATNDLVGDIAPSIDIGAIKQQAQQALNNQSIADKKQVAKNYLSSLIPMNTPLPNYGPIKAL